MTSEILFNAQTDFLMDSVMAIPYCKKILDTLKENYPIEESIITGNKTSTYRWLPNVIYKSKEYYLSYCLHSYEYFRRQKCSTGHTNYLEEYYSDMKIFSQGVSVSGNRMQVFKTEFIWPLLCYVISCLNEEAHIVHALERYKQRVEMFTKGTLHKGNELIGETKLQDDLALYLFDQGIEYCKEAQVGNGKIDFSISDTEEKTQGIGLLCQNEPYVIEVKRYSNNQKNYIDKWAKQLKTYMGRTLHKGCLVIFYDEEIGLKLCDTLNFKYISIYTGNIIPSKINKIIEVNKYQ